jgi:NitT/TauT family transport system substrate-binding protein
LNAGSVSVAGVYIAAEKKFFEAEGLSPEIVYFDDPTLITAGVVSGDLDVGFLGLAAGIYNAGGNGDLKLIGIAVDEKPGFKSLALITSATEFAAGFQTPAGLKDKRIGINAFGSSTQYAAMKIARKNGFELAKPNFVPLGALPNVVNAVKAGAVDAGVVPGPLAMGAEKTGEVKILRWVGEEVPFAVAGIFSRADDSRREVLVKFMRGYLRGVKAYDHTFQHAGSKESPEAEELLAIISKGARAPAANFRDALPFLNPDASIDVANIREQIEFWKALSMTPASVSADTIVHPDIVAAASKGQ